MAEVTSFLADPVIWSQMWPFSPPVPPTTPEHVLATEPVGPGLRIEGSLILPGAVHTGILGESHLDVIMEKILVKPRTINVGTVLSTQLFMGIVWNTHRETPADLEAIAALGDNTGIVVSGLAVDDIITPRRDRVITYQVSRSGPLDISVTFQFSFDIGTVLQSLSGSRGIVLTLRPLSAGYVESIGWATDIVLADNGKEYRSTKMPNGGPIRGATLPFRARNVQEIMLVQHALQFGARFTLYVPLWGSMMELTGPVSDTSFLPVVTANADFDNLTRVIVIEREGHTFESRGVLSVGATQIEVDESVDGFDAGDLVVPIVQMTPAPISSVRYSSERKALGALALEEVR